MIARLVSRSLRAVLIAVLIVGGPSPAFAYLKFGVDVNGRSVTVKWARMPVTYYVTDSGVPGITSSQFQSAVARAFSTWEAVPTAAITYRFAAFTTSRPGDDDGRSTLGFLREPTQDRVLASTSFLIDDFTGEVLESDIFFNSIFDWSASTSSAAGKWDLESIALHEIGHMSGLGHSAIGETEVTGTGRRVLSSGAVMFPIALGAGDISLRTLQPDDVAGISDLYPDGGVERSRGSISGRVTRNGQGVFGAHVVAFDPLTGESVANFTLNASGRFAIGSLRPGPQLLRVEPLDDGDVDSFFDHGVLVDASFRPRFYDHLVVVPRGGDSGQIDIAVVAK